MESTEVLEKTKTRELKPLHRTATNDDEFRIVALADVEPDPDQPRKTFDPVKQAELTASIGSKGLIQHAGIRPHPTKEGKYMMIYGERRLHSLNELKYIEFKFRFFNVNDPIQIREIQIIENMERDNLHPMEQAAGIKALMELPNYKTEDVAIRLNKDPYFIRRQVKLNSLTEKWQKLFLRNAITPTNALLICQLSPEAQEEWYKLEVTKEDEKNPNLILSLNTNRFRNFQGLLNQAKFDTTSTTLCPSAGACTNCPFNSSIQLVFPGEAHNPRCNKISCFNEKTETQYKITLKEACEDPTVLLVYQGWQEDKTVEWLRKKKHDVIKMGYENGQAQSVSVPQEPNLEAIKKQHKNDKAGEKKAQAQYANAQKDYNNRKEIFDKSVEAGKFKKAFVVSSGNSGDAGKFVYVQLTVKTKAADVQKKIKTQEATPEEIETERNRITNNEKRAKELDGEKIQEAIAEAVVASKSANSIPSKFTDTDKTLLHYILWMDLSRSSKEVVEKHLKKSIDSLQNARMFTQLKELTPQQVALIIRQIIIDRCQSSLPDTERGYMLRKLAESLPEIPIPDIEKNQQAKAAERKKRVDLKLKGLVVTAPQKKKVPPATRTNSTKKKRKASAKAVKK